MKVLLSALLILSFWGRPSKGRNHGGRFSPLKAGLALRAGGENRTVSIIETTNTSLKVIKKKKKKKKSSTRKKQEQKQQHGGQEADCLRRIKREWKDAVKMGIAYDWINQKTVVSKSADPAKIRQYRYVRIGPLGKSLLRWHFSLAGTPNSEYQDGVYHGRVLLPKDYPMSPPRIQLLTPSGRFITGADICLSASAFHPESWTPRWTVLALVEALRLHMLTQANEIGGMSATPEERRKMARASRVWASGKIQHGAMIAREELFPLMEEDDKAVENIIPQKKEEQKKTKRLAPISAAAGEHDVRERYVSPSRSSLIVQIISAVLKVLLSPGKLAVLAILTALAFMKKV